MTNIVVAAAGDGDHVAGMRNLWLKDRLRELRPKGKTAAGLAQALGLPATRISEMVHGKRRIGAAEVPRMADYLEMPEAVVLAHIAGGAITAAELQQVMVVGAVQAGAWREALEWPTDEWYPSPAGTNPRYAHLRQFGLEVRGPSMNDLYPPGSVIVCVKLIDLGRDPSPGERVVCQRRGNDDQFEATVKELRHHEDGSYWLWPRSSDPNFQQPWRLPAPGDADFDGEDIRLVALVIGSYRPEA